MGGGWDRGIGVSGVSPASGVETRRVITEPSERSFMLGCIEIAIGIEIGIDFEHFENI
jgi:hypothetical protein